MPSEPIPPAPTPRPVYEGPLGLARSLIHSLTTHWEARVMLFRIEAREASTAVTRRAFLFACACAFLCFAYVLLIVSAVSLASDHYRVRWEYITLGVAMAHLVAAFIFLAVVRARSAQPLFENSLKELEKDRQWLKTRDQSRP